MMVNNKIRRKDFIMKVLIDNEEIRISLSEEFIKSNTFLDGKSLGDFILENTLEKFKLYRKIFNVDKLEKIYFEIYDVVTEKDVWKDRYISFYGKNPPEYSLGFFEPDCNLSCTCVHANAAYGTSWWNSAVYTNAHEAFHLYYRKYIYGFDRITWFDEGMAEYLSGENDYWLNDEEKFKERFIYFLEHYVPIDNLNERIQGNSTVSDKEIFQRKDVFNGYLASVLIIKYLSDSYGEDYLFNLMRDNQKIREVGSNVLPEMIDYFRRKFRIIDSKKL